jgi:hypothetical protein
VHARGGQNGESRRRTLIACSTPGGYRAEHPSVPCPSISYQPIMHQHGPFVHGQKAGLKNETQETRNERRILAWPRPDRRSGSFSVDLLISTGAINNVRDKILISSVEACHDQVLRIFTCFLQQTAPTILQYGLRKPNLNHEAPSAVAIS